MRKHLLAVSGLLIWACASPSSPSDVVEAVASAQALTEGCPRGIDINRAAQGFLLGQADELGIYYCQESREPIGETSQCEPDSDVYYFCDAGYNGATDYRLDASSHACTATESGGVSNLSKVKARDHINKEDEPNPNAGWYDFGFVYCECDERGAHCEWM